MTVVSSSKDWKSVPLWGFVTIALTKVIEKGIVGMINIGQENNKTKVRTVFDWEKPEHNRIFDEAKNLKTEGDETLVHRGRDEPLR